MTINVTQSDIQKGSRNNCVMCPIALAIRRAIPGSAVLVGGKRVDINGKNYDLPESARKFIYQFDNDTQVIPFSFTLGEPNRFQMPL
jgi:hypothetical protein